MNGQSMFDKKHKKYLKLHKISTTFFNCPFVQTYAVHGATMLLPMDESKGFLGNFFVPSMKKIPSVLSWLNCLKA